MAEPLACDFRVNAGREQVRRMGVAKIVEPEPRQAGARNLTIPIVRQGIRLDRQAILPRIDESAVCQSRAKPE